MTVREREMSQLTIRYSAAYDAQIGGWTGALDEQFFNKHHSDWETDYVSKGKRFAADCQSAWDLTNDSVFSALREFGYEFPNEWVAYPVHPWSEFLAFKDPLTFLIEDDVDNACSVLVHELVHCHEDYPANHRVYEPVRAHIFNRFPNEPISVRYHIITNLVQEAVLRRAFPARSLGLVAQTSGHPALQRTAEIVSSYESSIDYDDPLSSLLSL